LAVPLPPERAAAFDKTLWLIKEAARKSGLLQDAEVAEVRVTRFLARCRLGEALRKLARKRGPLIG
jgi:hypothetical protein